MPPMAVGTNWMTVDQLALLLVEAFSAGFRAIDTARDYGNEDIVGDALKIALKETGLNRSDIFVTTKIGNAQQVSGDIYSEIQRSLDNLKTDYLDLWLMHWPYPDYFIKTWSKMVDVYNITDLVRAIGVANYQTRHLKRLIEMFPTETPHVNQVEFHPLNTAVDLRRYMGEHGIALQAYCPLCRFSEGIKKSDVLDRLAKKYGKSIGQLVLRWHFQNESMPVFKSYNPKRFSENANIFDFQLEPEELKVISNLNADYKYHVESVNCPGY